jgi:hypothetical protein
MIMVSPPFTETLFAGSGVEAAITLSSLSLHPKSTGERDPGFGHDAIVGSGEALLNLVHALSLTLNPLFSPLRFRAGQRRTLEYIMAAAVQ